LDEKNFRETRTAEKEAFSASLLKIYKKIPGSLLDTQGSFREVLPSPTEMNLRISCTRRMEYKSLLWQSHPGSKNLGHPRLKVVSFQENPNESSSSSGFAAPVQEPVLPACQ
jgi:hypothetical protein